jgi:hypothetical protein
VLDYYVYEMMRCGCIKYIWYLKEKLPSYTNSHSRNSFAP